MTRSKRTIPAVLLAGALVTLIAPRGSAQFSNPLDLATFGPSEGLVVTGTHTQSQLGREAISAGDINGDQIDDFALFMHVNPLTGSSDGALVVVFGSPTLDSITALDPTQLDGTNGFIVTTGVSGIELRPEVDAAGDVNGDGFDDLIIVSDGTFFSLCVYVVFGAASMPAEIDGTMLDGTNGFTTVLPPTLERFGTIAGIGDVNGDGYDDMAFADPNASHSQQIHQLAAQQNSFDAYGIASGDFDNDGDVDFVATYPQFKEIFLLNSVGDGTVFIQTSFPEPFDASPEEVVLADIDGDDSLDLIMGTGADGTARVCVMRNNLGLFHSPAEYVIGVADVRLDVGDFNGDSHLDIATMHLSANNSNDDGERLVVLFNDGTGAFTVAPPIQFGNEPDDLVSADWDDDGDLDIAVLETEFNQLRLAVNDGFGGFSLHLVATLQGGWNRMVATDLDGDTRPDLAFCGNGGFGTMINLGGLNFSPDVTYLNSGGGREIIAADLDNDGDNDLLSVGESNFDDNIVVCLNDGNGVFGDPMRHWTSEGPVFPAVADIDLDGDLDLGITRGSAASFHTNNGNGSFDSINSGHALVLFGSPTLGASGTVELDALDGSNGFEMPSFQGLAEFGRCIVGVGDINGDGIDDFGIGEDNGHWNGPGSGSAYFIFGSPTLGAGGAIDVRALTPDEVLIVRGEPADRLGFSLTGGGDLNGDGHRDVVTRAYFDDIGLVAAYYGPLARTGGEVSVGGFSGTDGVRIPGLGMDTGFGRSISADGDFNGDGLSDLLIGDMFADTVGNRSGGAYLVFGAPEMGTGGTLDLSMLDGTDGFEIRASEDDQEVGRGVALEGDYNGDGLADALVGAPRTNFGGLENSGTAYLIFGSRDCATEIYCPGTSDSAGCSPSLAATGSATLTGTDDLALVGTDLANQTTALLVLGRLSANLPYGNGVLCVGDTFTKGRVFPTGGSVVGTDCTGSLLVPVPQYDMLKFGLTSGSSLYAQILQRDTGAPGGIALSNALRLTICP